MPRLLIFALALTTLLFPSGAGAVPATPTTDEIQYGIVAGNAFSLLEDEIGAAPANEVSVLVVGPDNLGEGEDIAAVVYNATDSAMSVEVAFRIRDSEGTLVATVSGESSRPAIVEAGGLGLVVTSPPSEVEGMSNLELEPRVSANTPGDFEVSTYAAPEIVEVAPTREGYAGIAQNSTSQEMSLILFNIVCFDDEGHITGGGTTTADSDPIEAGGDTGFSFDSARIRATSCNYFLLAGSGWI